MKLPGENDRFFFTDLDRRIWEEELEPFVPSRVFDAHTHIWSEANALPETRENPLRFPVDAAALKAWQQALFPGRRLGFMILGTPIQEINFAAEREWCVAESKKLPDTVCGVLVTPRTDPARLAADARRLGFRALKPYLVFAEHTTESPISELIPEVLVEVADELGLMIVLHVSRPECFSDPENLRELEYFTRKYPRAVWQLAHCARSFNSALLERSILRLREIGPICYDLSAVCDPYTMYLLFRHEDRSRLMYGSDNVSAGALHGSYAPFARSWGFYPANDRRGTFICYEQLRAMRRGAIMAEVPEEEIARIFWDNACRIYGLRNE